jgi:hypothetical protein
MCHGPGALVSCVTECVLYAVRSSRVTHDPRLTTCSAVCQCQVPLSLPTTTDYRLLAAGAI